MNTCDSDSASDKQSQTGSLRDPSGSGCIEFDGARLSSGGYGAIRHEGKVVRAHRLAYCHANGVTLESIAGFEVRHSCDNPPCINPAHLLLGTHTDNMRDMFERDRRKLPLG